MSVRPCQQFKKPSDRRLDAHWLSIRLRTLGDADFAFLSMGFRQKSVLAILGGATAARADAAQA